MDPICLRCGVEASKHQGITEHKFESDRLNVTPIPRDPNPEYDRAAVALSWNELSTASTDPEQFINKAKKIASVHYSQFLPEAAQIKPEEFYVCWFKKTLQNWAAMVSTDVVNGLYYEITYDGDKKQSYADAYIKQENQVFTDEYLDSL